MKNILKTCLLVLLSCTLGQSQITSGEYFWDTDPGIDLATPIPSSVFVGVTDDTYSFSPPTTGISPGSHRLYFRFKDSAGELSQTVSQFVYIGQTGIPSIADDEVGLLEYYWDTNSTSPTQITLTNPAVDGNYTFDAPSTGLIVGLHHINVRVKDKYGLWSGYNKVPIFIHGTTPLPNIQKIEYYVDTDLGEGLNTSVSFTPAAANDVTSNFEIPTAGLSNGQHVATMRVQDTDGNWSGKFSKAFDIDPQFTLAASALTGQYYCLGGSIEVPITRTGTWPAENEYRLELSDNTGNNFVPIPTTTSFGGGGDKLIGTIPNGLTISGGYKIRAVTTLPYIRKESSTVFTIGISATASVNIPICAGEDLNYTSTSSTPATYSWSGPNALSATQNPTLSNAQVDASGNYTVTATNVGGCTATATVAALVNPNPTPNAGVDKAICAGNSTSIGSAAVGGNTYVWSPSAGLSSASVANPTASPSSTTTYQVTMTTTATGCSATDNVVLTVNPNPTPNTGIDKTICAGNSTSIGSAAVAGNTYAWSPTAGLSSASVANPTASPSSTTTYQVTMTTTATGCSATDNVVITVNPNPTPNAGVDKTICAGNSTSIGSAAVAGNTYVWSPTAGLSSASIANPTASPSATTTYIVTMTRTATGCSATDKVVLTVNPNPTPNAGVDKTICAGNSTSIGSAAVAGNTYAWSPSAGLSSASVANPTANPSGTTTYMVTMTNTATGCSGTDNVLVTVNPNPILNTNNQTIGGSGFVNLTLSAVTSGISLPGGTMLSYFTNAAATMPLSNPNNVTTPGTYYIKATTAGGCIDIEPVSVIAFGGCLNNLTLVSPTDNSTSEMTNKITSGLITATNKISGTANYTMDAKNEIVLNPGFLASGSQAVFLAKIGGCN